MPGSDSSTVKDLFDAEHSKGDFVCSYYDWELPLSDGTKLTGCISHYVVVRRLGAAYFELYLNVHEPARCAGIIDGLLEPFVADPQFLLPETMRNNEIRIRRNEQDVKVRYNQLPVMPSFTIYPCARLDLWIKETLVQRWRSKGVELIIMDQIMSMLMNAHYVRMHLFAMLSEIRRLLLGLLRNACVPKLEHYGTTSIVFALAIHFVKALKMDSNGLIAVSSSCRRRFLRTKDGLNTSSTQSTRGKS